MNRGTGDSLKAFWRRQEALGLMEGFLEEATTDLNPELCET